MPSACTLARRGTRLLLLPTLLAAQTAPPPAAHPAAPPAQAVIGPGSQIHPPGPGYHFPTNQTWVYEVDWRLLTAGVATLHIEPAGSEQRMIATADSVGVVSLLYRVHDHFEAYFDTRNFCSSLLTKRTEEGFRRRDTLVRFDYGRRRAVLQEKDLKTGQSKQVENDLPGCVTDVVSGIYYVGSLPLQQGLTFTFPLNDGGKTVGVRAHVQAREQIKTPAGTFQTLRVQPEAASGVLKDKGQVWIWYTDDAAHTPVQMRARLFWGTLTFRLQRIEKK
jgi:hypothetical protein